MLSSRILIGGLIGGVVAFALGFLVYGMLMNDFYAANSGTATGVNRSEGEMVWWAMIVAHLAFGLLLAIILGYWANISTFATGAKAGAIIGFLLGCFYNLMSLGTMHIMNSTAAITDIVVGTIVTAIVGGVIGLWLRKGSTAT